MKKAKMLLYIDQYGNQYKASSRKNLVKAVSPYGSPKVSIMYRDKADGSTVRCGYTVGNHWLIAYEPIETKVNL